MRLPSHVSLVHAHDMADVVVANFGLHYGDVDVYRADMEHVLAELDAFARSRRGRVSVFREVSSQHFPVPTGDYLEAVKRDPALVVLGNRSADGRAASGRGGGRLASGAAPSWSGPSMCAPSTETKTRWRNEVLHGLAANVKRVRMQPFEQLTRARWDYHASIRWVGGQFKSDCTHFCYSQCFWERSFHDLFLAIAKRTSVES